MYAKEVLEHAGMLSCKSCPTPVDTKSKLSTTTRAQYEDPSIYPNLGCVFQCLTFTRPNISYAVQQICLFMHNPMEVHMQALRRIFRYIKGTSQCTSPVFIAYHIIYLIHRC